MGCTKTVFRELITEFYDAAQAQAPPGVTVRPPILEPATPAQIAHAEDTMQLTFTDELREWYLTSNHHFVLGRLMVTLTSRGRICPPEDNWFKSWDHLLPGSGEIVDYDQIFTFSSDDGTNDFLLYVLAGDRRGEVVRVCFDKLPHQKLVTPMFQSLEEWLRFNIEAVRRGHLNMNDAGQFLNPTRALSPTLVELLDQHDLPHHWYY